MCSRRAAAADRKKTITRVVLLQSVILAGTTMTGSGSVTGSGGGSVACKGWSAGSLSSALLLRPAHTPFLAAKRKGLVGLPLGIARQEEERTPADQPVAIEMVASTGRERSKAAQQAYHERKREALSAWSEERQGRDLCERCRRARKVRQ